MGFSHFVIDRPVFAVVISVLILLMGAIAYPQLGAAQYPNIVPPTVNVTLSYPGATAETLAETVADPIEEQINGVDDMIYMSSQSTGDGSLQITVTFKVGTDLDRAQELVQDRVETAVAQLPVEVQQTGIAVRKSSPDILLAVHLYSPDGSLDQQHVANYSTLFIQPALLRVYGVGDIVTRAARDYAIRVWINPDLAAARSITVDDILAALRSHNIQVPAGDIGAPPFGRAASAFQTQIEAQGRLVTPAEFGDIVIKRDADGRITRVRDVARVDLGAANYTTNAYLGTLKDGKPDTEPAAAIGVLQLPGTNALKAADGVLAEMDELKKSFPPGLGYQIIYNPTDYIRESINEVYKTLAEALVLVAIVVMVFLQSWRTALIPLLAIPVSLIGTFAVMLVAGFSLNNLSLFGLVLAIGIVVDDAIVVVENVERHLEQGKSPREAAHATMDEVGGAIVAIALVLGSVFIPAAFIAGVSGEFYRQFALTIASATAISLIVSLTLSPAMAALLLRKPDEGRAENRFIRPIAAAGRIFHRNFERLSHGYGRSTGWLVGAVAPVLAVYVVLIALTVWRLLATPTGFIPTQDQGSVIMAANLPAGASLARTDAVIRRTVPINLTTPGIIAASTYAGVDGTTNTTNASAGQAYLVESSFADRAGRHIQLPGMIADLEQRLTAIPDARIRILPPPPVRGIGTQGGVKLIIEDRTGAGGDYRRLQQVTEDFVAAANKDPDVADAYATFNVNSPRIEAQINRVKAEYFGVPDSAVFDTLETFLGSSFVNNFTYLNHTYDVFAQADADYRQDEARLLQLQTRSANGAMMPLASVVTLERTTGPYRVLRYQLYPAAEVQAQTPPGHSSGQTIAAMEKLAQRVLPTGFSHEWTELAYQQQAAGNTATIVFGLAVVLVFLLLAALYESLTMPLAVILIVPMCLLAAVTGVNVMGMDNNILTQIGFIVLIGLAAKNAILIVEFARQGEQNHNLDRRDAAVEAARTRLRPILMTSFAFILGVIPLAFAGGAGAELRRALGVAVFFGMIGVTAFGLAFTPVFYVATRWLSERLPQPPGVSRSPGSAGERGGEPAQ